MNNTLEGLNPWASLIYKDHYDGDLSKMIETAAGLTKGITLDHPLEIGGRSTWDLKFDILELPEFCNLKEWIIDKHTQVWNAWGLKDYRRKIERSWINWHPPGAHTSEHRHTGVQLIATVYLQNPVNGGNIQFKDPLEYHWTAHPKTDDPNYITIPVTTGDVLFFPGFIYHQTETNNSEEDRYALTVNIVVA